MNIVIRNAYEPASADAGLSVFVDVFRASTTLACLLRGGRREILGAVNESVVAGYRDKGYTVVSEVLSGGADNSPSAVSALSGAGFIQKTGNFSAAVFANMGFRRAIAAAFVNISAAADYIRTSGEETVELVACGHFDERKEAIEDVSCVRLLAMILEGRDSGEVPYMDKIRAKIDGRRKSGFPFPAHYWQDLEMALKRDTVPLVPVISKVNSDLISISVGKL